MALLALLGACVLCFLYQSGRRMENNVLADSIPVGILDRDQSSLSADLISFMPKYLHMDILQSDSYDELADALLDAEISVIVEIPQGMEQEMLEGKKPKLTMTHLEDYANKAFTENYLNIYMNRAAILAAGAGQDKEAFRLLLEQAKNNTLTVQTVDREGYDKEAERDKFGVELVIGLSLMLICLLTMFMGMLILEDKDLGIFRRLQASPVKAFHYILGQTLCGFSISALFIGILLLYLKATGSRTGIPLWLLTVICLLYVLFSVGFSLMVSFLTKSRVVMMTATVGFSTLTSILGGAWFSLADELGGLEKLSLLTPHYWIMETIRGMQSDGSYDYFPALAVLVLFTVLVFLITAVVYNRREA